MTFTAAELALVQPEVIGSPSYRLSYARRACVEAYFGNLKVSGGLRSTNVRFHHHGKCSLGYTFLAAATNLLMVARWRKRQAKKAKLARAAEKGTARPSRRTRGTNKQLTKRNADTMTTTANATTTAPDTPPPKKRRGVLAHLDE